MYKLIKTLDTNIFKFKLTKSTEIRPVSVHIKIVSSLFNPRDKSKIKLHKIALLNAL